MILLKTTNYNNVIIMRVKNFTLNLHIMEEKLYEYSGISERDRQYATVHLYAPLVILTTS